MQTLLILGAVLSGLLLVYLGFALLFPDRIS